MTAILALFFAFACQAAADTATPLKGVALVIGQSKYQHLAPLANPANDAGAVEKLFGDLGFAVTIATDRDARKLRRDLENFVDDAAGADVAVVYYSGHAIEAGGENWLVPIDADLSALDDAGERLVPLSALIDELKAKAPVAILFLDACRSNPFPPGALLKKDGTPVAVSPGGLALSKGAVAVSQGVATDGLGTLIGFAAEPGRAALDGPAGGNSPYAAALLKHLAAMDGAELGTVMRMVTEEVYLKTRGRQRPWVNETLTRLLYFGAPAEDFSGDEGQILKERRQLLLTISALPEFERRQVEAAADQGGVPMDALFGLLRTLGADTPNDPAELDKILKTQTEKLKSILAESTALQSQDAEMVRLSALADAALAEGALDANVRFREAAKARFNAIAATLDTAEADLKARRLEGGAIFAKTAQAYELKADYLSAAENFAEAFTQVERWDRQRAWEYRMSEADALRIHGDEKGDNDALRRSIETFKDALELSPRAERPRDWATTQNNLGNALHLLGERESGTARLEEAVSAQRSALQEWTRERAPLDWALTQTNLGDALLSLGQRESGAARLEEAVASYRAALEVRTRERLPLQWARTENNLAIALQALGERESATARLDEAVTAYRSALQEFTRERAPLDWAAIENNLGTALHSLAERESGTTRLEEAIAAYRAALQERTRERVPLDWAATQNNLGTALHSQADRETGTARLEEAVASYRAALQERTRERVPLDWAMTQNNLGNALLSLGQRKTGTVQLEDAATAYRAALEERTRARVPLDWAATEYNLGNALQTLGRRETGTARLEEAVASYRASLQELTRERVPLDWARTQNSLGVALHELGGRETGTARLEEAIGTYRAALEERTRERVPLDWAATENNLGIALQMLGNRESGTARLEEAVTAYRAVLEESTRERVPLDWAGAQNNLGVVLQVLGSRQRGTARLEEAVTAYRAALQQWTRERVPFYWAGAQDNLGDALQALGERTDGAGGLRRLEEAIAAWRNVALVRTREQQPAQWADMQDAIGYQLVRIGEREDDLSRFAEAVPILRAALSVRLQLDADQDIAGTSGSLCGALLGVGVRTRDRIMLLEARQLCESAVAGMKAAGSDAVQETQHNLARIEGAIKALP